MWIDAKHKQLTSWLEALESMNDTLDSNYTRKCSYHFMEKVVTAFKQIVRFNTAAAVKTSCQSLQLYSNHNHHTILMNKAIKYVGLNRLWSDQYI